MLALLRFVEVITADAPVVLVLDDLERADDESMAFVRLMLLDPTSLRVLAFPTADLEEAWRVAVGRLDVMASRLDRRERRTVVRSPPAADR